MFKAHTLVLPAGVATLCLIAVLAYHGLQQAESSTQAVANVKESSLPIMLKLRDMRAGVLRIVASTSEQALLHQLTPKGADADEHNEAKAREAELTDSGQQSYDTALLALEQLFATPRNEASPENSRRQANLAQLAKSYANLLRAAAALKALTHSAQTKEIFELKEDFEACETEMLSTIQQALNAELALTTAALAQSAADTSALRDGIEFATLLVMLAVALLTISVIRLHARESAARQRAERSAEKLAKEIDFRQLAEAQLVAAQKLSGMGTLLGGIAHSINNHLAPILSLSQLMRGSLPSDSMERRDAEHIAESAKRARKVLDDLLAFARNANNDPGSEQCEAITCLNQVLKIAATALPSTIQLDIRFDIEQAWIGVSSTELENMALNLLSNARDAIADQTGNITISGTTVDAERAASETPIIGAAATHYLRLEISDTGKGIAKEDLSRLFDPFFTTKAVGKGTGLGLAVSYGIVTRASGMIAVTSEPGRGSCFKVFLPILDNHAVPAKTSP
jgi:signal transduction histidine kinase